MKIRRHYISRALSQVDLGGATSTRYITWIFTGRRRRLVRRLHIQSGSFQVDTREICNDSVLHDSKSCIINKSSKEMLIYSFIMKHSFIFLILSFPILSISYNWLFLSWWWNLQLSLPWKAFLLKNKIVLWLWGHNKRYLQKLTNVYK